MCVFTNELKNKTGKHVLSRGQSVVCAYVRGQSTDNHNQLILPITCHNVQRANQDFTFIITLVGEI